MKLPNNIQNGSWVSVYVVSVTEVELLCVIFYVDAA